MGLNVISNLEVELKRDERIMRFLTVKLDKNAAEYAEKRRNISYLDEYQELIKGLEKNKINDSIQSNIDTNQLSVTIAGS